MSASLRLVERPDVAPPFCGMVGSHPLMLSLYEDVRAAAPLDSPVLIEGRTGTGKELVARALHGLSGRKGNLVAVNAAELAEPLAEAELFGALRGAFTGAVSNRAGLILSAHDGTLFLDEAGDLPHAIQLKLLRVLESGRIRHVGAEAERVVRFRLVLTVQEAADELVASGRWRRDFYYRAVGISLRAPCLSQRRSDIPALANHFLIELGAAPLAAEELALLQSHAWPGNVRELRRVVERALHRARGAPVTAEGLRNAVEGEVRAHPGDRRAPGWTLRDAERRHIEATLEELEWDPRTAAAVLGISRSALYRRMQDLDIVPPRAARSRK